MAQMYKVKLQSGRVLGPLDLERIRGLILKNQILGKELARAYPNGDWVSVSVIPEIADLLVARASGALRKDSPFSDSPGSGTSASTHLLPGSAGAMSLEGATVPMLQEDPPSKILTESDTGREEEKTSMLSVDELGNPEGEEGDKTQIGSLAAEAAETRSEGAITSGVPMAMQDAAGSTPDEPLPASTGRDSTLAREETVMISAPKKKKKGISSKERIKATVAALALGIAGYQLFFSPTEPGKGPIRQTVIRPELPRFQANPDPNQSQKAYLQGLQNYVLDNVAGYHAAAAQFSTAAALDVNDIKATAMLASSYINLIDSSNKDENYFSVISKLIDMTRAKNVDLPETVIADVEFFCVVNKPEAAENRIVEYTKTHATFGLEMFYYLALAFYTRGDFQSASRYISQIPDNKAFSAKVFYLEGQIAEKLDDTDAALVAYGKALQRNKLHAKSRLRIADIKNQRGRIQDAREDIDLLVNHPELLRPNDLGHAYYLHSILREQDKKYEEALGDAERAVQLDKDDHDFLLQLYSMRQKAGESIGDLRKDARMYYFLGEGERLLKAGKLQEALTQFLQARQANNASPIPLVKIGDMFGYLHDLGNARLNYKMAADRAPNNISIWSKYIDVLIQSFEWDEASKAMDRFRELPVSQSAIDKAAGDMYSKQAEYEKAQTFYRKAMARDVIDPSVYMSYADSLMKTHNYKEAPFFFALAQRYDPLNIDAVIGTAKCVANTESIDRAISMLQDELQKGNGSKSELLSAIAEFQIQKGQWDEAQKTVDEAMRANPDYALPWKLQAQLYMNKEGSDRTALDKALSAYQSYSDRNASDPSGYIERYKIFTNRGQYDKASDELGKIFGIYPKYPSLHFDKGLLYGLMGNHKLAIEEYKTELQNNSLSVDSLLALGKEYLEMQDANSALAQFSKAMQLAPQSGEPKQMAGYANYLLKNFPGAVALYQAALQKDPGNPLIYKRLGLAYRDMGDQGSATQAFKKYLQMEPDAPDHAQFDQYK